MAKRTYLVGLPVLVTVDDDGTVEYDVDTAEAGASIRDYEEDWPTEATLEADAATVDADHDKRSERSL